MNLFYYISDFIIPILIVYILVTGLAAKIPVYDEFVKGAAEAADSTGAMDPFSGGIGSTGNRALVFFLGCYIIGTGHL